MKINRNINVEAMVKIESSHLNSTVIVVAGMNHSC